MSRYEARRDRLRRRFRAAGTDALLVTSCTNVTYLTGFSGDDSFLLLAEEGEVVLSDSRYTTQLEQECPGLDLAIRKPEVPMHESVAGVVRAARVRRLGVEAGSMTLALYQALAGQLSRVELVPTAALVERLRMVKDREEIARIRVAVRQAERGFEVIRAALRGGQTELDVAADLEHQLRKFGSAGCSFPSIVAVGPRAALPHATPTGQLMSAADFVLVDWGASEGQYVSDLTRLVVTGKISAKLHRIYGVVLKAQLAAIGAIRPGVRCGQVDRTARAVIARAGFGKAFGHGLGHGIGLEVHEAPRLRRNEETELKPGMIVTVEPGIYLPGWGGVRIEDDVLVTRSGHEVLTSTPKQLEQCVVR